MNTETESEEKGGKAKRIRWTDYEIYELIGEFKTPCVASQPLLLDEEYDEKGRKKISKAVFPRDENGKAYFPPGWIAGLLEETSRKDLWKLAPQLKETKVELSLSPEKVMEIFKENRLAASHIHQFTFMDCEILGNASPVIQRYATSFDMKGKQSANIFDAETFPTGTQFRIKIIAPKIFYQQLKVLLEIGGAIQGIGPSAMRRKGYGRFKVVSFKKVAA
jgi:hypothetical protein